MNPKPPGDANRREAWYADVRARVACRPGADPSAAEMLLHLIHTSDTVETRVARALARHGLSTAAYNVLMILHNTDGHARPLHEMSELLLVSRANVTGLIDNLEQRGWVERAPDPHDRRVRHVRLRAAAGAIIERITPEVDALLGELCRGISEADRETLVRLLRKVRASCEEAGL